MREVRDEETPFQQLVNAGEAPREEEPISPQTGAAPGANIEYNPSSVKKVSPSKYGG